MNCFRDLTLNPTPYFAPPRPACDVYVSGHAAYRESAHGLILTELCSGGGLGWPNNFGQLSEKKKKCDNGLLYPPYPAKLGQGEDHL